MTNVLLFLILLLLIYVAKAAGTLVFLGINSAADIESILDFVSKKTAATVAQDLKNKGYRVIKEEKGED